MCLGIPAKVIDVVDKDGLRIAIVDLEGVVTEVDATLIQDLKPGEYVIVHAGMAIEKLDPKEAEESLRVWKELIEALEKEGLYRQFY